MRKQLTNNSLVPVAYQVRMSDGRWGTIFHHPDKPLGEHRTLYAQPACQQEDLVEEMGGGDVIAIIEPDQWDVEPQLAYARGWNAALRVQKGDDTNG